jgi:hypothetical protein
MCKPLEWRPSDGVPALGAELPRVNTYPSGNSGLSLVGEDVRKC